MHISRVAALSGAMRSFRSVDDKQQKVIQEIRLFCHGHCISLGQRGSREPCLRRLASPRQPLPTEAAVHRFPWKCDSCESRKVRVQQAQRRPLQCSTLVLKHRLSMAQSYEFLIHRSHMWRKISTDHEQGWKPSKPSKHCPCWSHFVDLSSNMFQPSWCDIELASGFAEVDLELRGTPNSWV